jgi:Ca2+-transporting ATPase
MVTGDHPATAGAIAREVGILAEGGRVVTGEELDALDDASLRDLVARVDVFARATPEHKYRIVTELQDRGEVVAVTGDGVNDALALQAADIGVAMGQRGTDVAREASDAVISDDDYVTLAAGVFEGRTFRDNLRKGVKYYLAVKLALVLIFLLPVLAGLPLPFAPIQIILLELFMDLAASAGFVSEPPEPGVRTRRPAKRTAQLFDRPQLWDLVTKALLLFGAVIGVFLYARASGFDPASARTFAFASWMVGHVTLAFVSRSDTEGLIRLGPFSNRVMDVWALAAVAFLLAGVYVPALGRNIDLVPVAGRYLAADAAFTALVIAVAEVRKSLLHREDRGRAGAAAPARR